MVCLNTIEKVQVLLHNRQFEASTYQSTINFQSLFG